MSGLCAIFVLLTTGLADSVREHDGLSTMDPRLAADVRHARSPLLTALARTFTFAGSEVVVGGIAVLLLLWLVARRDLARAAVVALAMGGSAVLTVAVKMVVARPRPGAVDRLGAVDSTFSFPSGHTLNSTVLVALIVWLAWPTVSKARRTPLVIIAAVTALAVGASRIYLGYHWTTDVLASGLVAAAWLSVVWLLSRPLGSAVAHVQSRRTPTART